MGSPSSVASPSRPFSQPVGIPPSQQQQNMYPNLAGGYDTNFAPAGGVQYPRFMTPPPQPRTASSYAAPSGLYFIFCIIPLKNNSGRLVLMLADF